MLVIDKCADELSDVLVLLILLSLKRDCCLFGIGFNYDVISSIFLISI